MQTCPAVLHERPFKRTQSDFHKLCLFDYPEPCGSETLQEYDFSHIKSPYQQLVFHKQEIFPTPISLPTPPAAPEFYGTSLQKWYQKKPLFTLTAKGQVKRLEKYLQIQKVLNMCKKEHEFQKHTQYMKDIYTDFEFREHQPLLYEERDVCCVCPCNSSRYYDVDFIPTHYRTCTQPLANICTCDALNEIENEREICDKPKKTRSVSFNLNSTEKPKRKSSSKSNSLQFSSMSVYRSENLVRGETIIPTEIVDGQDDQDDRGIYKIVVKNKERPRSMDGKYVFKLFDHENFEETDASYPNQLTPNYENSNCSKNLMTRINLDNVANLPFDGGNVCCTRKFDGNGRYRFCYSATTPSPKKVFNQKYDVNKNEIQKNFQEEYDVNKNEIF